MELGKKIKYYRNDKSFTQDSLAERVFVSRQTIQIGRMTKAIQTLTVLYY